MPLKDANGNQINPFEWMRQSNKTIAWIGKFRKDDPNPRYIFSQGRHQSKNEGPLDPATLFEVLKPCLYRSDEYALTIGKMAYRAYTLKPPISAGNDDKVQPILMDSKLMEAVERYAASGSNEDEHATIAQDIGGDLFKELLNNLNIVARFTHSHFAKSLLTIAKNYLLLYTNTKLPRNLRKSVANWNKIISTNQFVATAIVTYLVCYDGDNSKVMIDFRKNLQTHKFGKTQDEKRIIDQLESGLKHLKEILRQNTEGDSVWSQTIMQNDFESGWLENYADNLDFGISGCTQIYACQPNTFIAYYQTFIQASDALQRFVRTPTLHAFLFCWFASKYGHHTYNALDQAAKSMYQTSIQDEGKTWYRDYGEDESAIQRKVKKSKEAAERTIDKFAQQVGEQADSYKMYARAVQETIEEGFYPKRKFDSSTLYKRLEELFVLLSQLTSAEMVQLSKEIVELQTKLRVFNDTIVGLKKENQTLTINDFKKALQAKARDEDEKTFVQKVIENTEYPDNSQLLKERVGDAFASVLTQQCHEKLATNYQGQAENLKQGEWNLERIYRLRRVLNLPSSSEKSSLPGISVTTQVMVNTETEEKKAKCLKLFQSTAETVLNQSLLKPQKQSLPVPIQLRNDVEQLSSLISDGKIKGKINHGKVCLGNVQIEMNDEQEPVTIEIEMDSQENWPKLLSKEAQVEFDKKTYSVVEVFNADGSLDKFLRQMPLDKGLLPQFEQLSVSGNAIQEKYVNVQQVNDPLQSQFEKKCRAWLLGEYIAAAPKEETNLDGVDVSQVLGIMMDMVEKIGDPSVGEPLFNSGPDDKTTAKLPEINLSKYYPVVDDDDEGPGELADVLLFYYELAKSLQEVSSYLKELRDLKSSFNLLRNEDIKVIILNETLPEHVERVKAVPKYLEVQDVPAFIYLTKQSEADQGLLKFSNRILNALPKPTGQILQLPIVVSAQALNVNNVAMPVINEQGLSLPMIAPTSMTGSMAAKTLVVKDVPTNPLILMFLSLMVENNNVFGYWPKDVDVMVDLEDYLMDKVGVAFDANKPLVTYFRKIWLEQQEKHPHAFLRHNLIFVKWVNMALLLKAQGSNLKEGKLFDEAYTQQDYYEAAFSMSGLRNLQGRMIPYCGEQPIANGGFPPSLLNTPNFGAIVKNNEQAITFQQIDWRQQLGYL